MAGYIMTIGAEEYMDKFYVSKEERHSEDDPRVSSKEKAKSKAKEYALKKCIFDGTYSAKTSESGAAYLGTLADYLGMKQGDNIYFFTSRKIYGIGKLVNIADYDCRFRINPNEERGVTEPLVEVRDSSKHFFTCTFEPDPFFFEQGVDMDEVLLFAPEKVKSLRFFSGKTFIKLDDVENEVIRNAIARKNEPYISEEAHEYHFEWSNEVHRSIETKIQQNRAAYRLSVFDYIKRKKNEEVQSEYYLEGAIMDLLRNHESLSIGKWDFIGRQYPASPPKPSEYVEAMDIFGYRYVPGFSNAISKYLVIELKAGKIDKNSVEQTMKYVDWISREYAKGDYSMITAYTIGLEKEQNIDNQIEDIIERTFIIESHPVKSSKWNDIHILTYPELLRELREKHQNDEF